MDFGLLLDEHDFPGSPGPRGLVLAHPFEGKYYDYRDPRVSSSSSSRRPSGELQPYNLNWTLPHPGPSVGQHSARRPLQQHLALENILLLPASSGDISQRDKNGCKCQTTKGQIS